ncbi:MAG TPA: hypothetical protein PKH79_11095 [Prolixibacteraceae bacterium]|nr:hypothetical protein [Prolixibacteraceae bacterium]HPS13912.1 hypothetical protein [Prolixibacteraceae bacterium]
MNNEVRLLHNSNLDIQKWDQVIERADNSRIYAFSWYLSILHPDWHGLIYGDYDRVMPVIFSTKWGIEYAFQPIYAQQHGIFPSASENITSLFLSFLKERFRYLDISLNSLNSMNDPELKVENRKNYLLPLEKSYEETYQNYSSHCKRNLKKALTENKISSSISIEEFIRFKMDNNATSFPEELKNRLLSIISAAQCRNAGFLYGAYSNQGELCGASFFLNGSSRSIILNSVSSDKGKEYRSMYAIIDAFIRENSGNSLLLDFEGSNVEGIARFYHGFGAEPETYMHLKYNRLPWPVKLLKK